MPKQLKLLDELIVDNFAGGGGASKGIELATGRSVDIAINHDPSAIAMHKANHPYTKHYCESVWEVEPAEATQGKPVALCWFSPDCKHFSKAKGGKPVDKNIRGLAWIVLRWAAKVKPRIIILENVEEFKTWGPVKHGKPVKSKSGLTFEKWLCQLRSLGYKVDYRELKACDYGTPTIRKRLFIVARCDGKSIVWPEATHGPGKLPYRTAAEIIDWMLPCPSIFDTAEEIYAKHGIRAVRPLAEATLKRIARGIKKFVIDNPEPFIVQVNHSGDRFRGQTVNEPLPTLTAKHGYGIVMPRTVSNVKKATGQLINEPLSTIRTGGGGGQMLVTPTIIQYHGEQSDTEARGQSLGKPLMVVDASPRYGLVSAFISKYYDGGYTGAGAELTEPLPTITAWDHNAIVTSNVTKLKGGNIGQLITEPLQTITAGGLHFGEVRAFLQKYYGQGSGQSPDEPLHTVTGKDTFGIVTIAGEQYKIADIGLRMLTPRELFNAQGFPADYIIDAGADGKPLTKSAQVARCGNAVCPPLAEALVRANLPELCGQRCDTTTELEKEMAV